MKKVAMNPTNQPHPRQTLVIDNFRGPMSFYLYGDINSGRSWTQSVAGQNPFVKPGQLTWSEQPTQIDPTGSVITDMIVAGKERVESGILYVYAIGHTGRLYKIQVNNPSTYNPDYDNPVLLTTLTVNSPTFTKGGFMDFFGATEKIFIGHDKGVTSVDFAGTGEAFVGTLGSWTQNVPRPLKQYGSKAVGYALFAGNGNNLATINSTGTVVSYAQLSPALYTNTEIRDMDLSPEGTYLEMVVSSLPLYDITSGTQETTSTSSATSYIMKWNGIDTGVTSSITFPTFALASNTLFQGYQYTFGTDQYGTALYNPLKKIFAIPEGPAPLPNAVTSNGNLLLWMTPLYFNGVLEADLMCMGSYSDEVGNDRTFWDIMFLNSTAPETDIVRVPFLFPVSNTGLGASSNNYANNLFGSSKVYFSTLETSSAPTTKYRFYKWNTSTVSPLVVPTTAPNLDAVYQTQSQMFGKKVSVSEVRVYGEPWVTGNSFKIDLIGSDSLPIPNGSKIFTAGTNLTVGDDFAWYGPDMIPTYTLGVMITQLGTANFTINKIEIDYGPAGK